MQKVRQQAKARHREAIKSVKQPPQDQSYLFGVKKAQDDFSMRHQVMLKGYLKLIRAEDIVISGANRKMKNNMKDKMIYLLARQVFEDFDEILLLCGNGYSTGGLKILRGMFERTVTVCYLQKHPDDIERYYKYYYVRRRKEISAVRQTFPKALPTERLEQFETEYEEVKELFQVPVCEVCKVKECQLCKRTRDNHSWIRKDILQLAKEAEHFDPVVYLGYYRPMQESHATAQSIVHRVRFNASGRWEYVEGAKPEMDDHIFVVAHFLLIRAIEALGLQFNVRIKTRLSKLYGVYVKILKANTPRKPVSK